MEVYPVKTASILPLGKQGENLVRQIHFDLSRWISSFGPGTVQLLHQRSGDEAPYPVAIEQDGNMAVWTVTNADTAAPGTGRAELQYYVGDALAKSETWMTKVLAALGPASETPPEAQQGWVDQVLQAGTVATEAAEKAVNAAVRQPIVGGNGNWWTWDLEAGAYVDTGIYSRGDAPYIGDNGNWYVGQTDTGVAATGHDGADGKSAYQYAVEGGYTGTEEAFAAKLSKEMPGKLPNPNALTFTGAVTGSYDGSAPFEVEIPSGGGGITVTNTAAVGQTIRVSAVDDVGKPTEWEAVDMAEQVQADWNQNDSTAADYVKNRTHYEESVYVNYVLSRKGTEIVGLSMPEVGETMTVKINGVESAETVKEAERSIMGVSYKYIGNTDIDSLFNGGTGWCVIYVQEGVVGFANPDTTITVETLVVHKINDKFINFDGFVQTFNYYFKGYTLYKPLYNDDGGKCLLYTCNNFILPKPDSQLFGFVGEIGFSKVESTRLNSCLVTGFEIIVEDGSITVKTVVLGSDANEMEEIAAEYGYVHTTNPNA